MASKLITKGTKKTWTKPVLRKLEGRQAEEALRLIVAAHPQAVLSIKQNTLP